MMVKDTGARAQVRRHALVVARLIQAIQTVGGELQKIQVVVELRKNQARHHTQ